MELDVTYKDYSVISAAANQEVVSAPPAEINRHKKFYSTALSLLIYVMMFAAFYLIKKKAFVYDESYLLYIPVLISAWGLGGMISGKFRIKVDYNFIVCVKKCYVSLLISLGIAAFILTNFNLSISRFVVAGSFISAFLVETVIAFIKSKDKLELKSVVNGKISKSALFLDAATLTVSLVFLYEMKIGLINIKENYILLFAATYVSWGFAAMITRQFRFKEIKFNYWRALGNRLKFNILIFSLLIILSYMMQFPSALGGFGSLYLTSLLLYTIWSFILITFIYLDRIPYKTDDIKHDFLHAFELKVPQKSQDVHTEDYKYKLNKEGAFNGALRTRLQFVYLKMFPDIFEFLERKLDLSSFDVNKILVLRSADPYNIQVQSDNQLEMFINLHELNDVRYLNRYFIDVNYRLVDGGIFVGNFEPIIYRYKRFVEKYPFFIAHLFYAMDFIWHRATPKLPVVRKLFFALTKGRDRAISLAEGLGRLYYCGFEVLDLTDHNNVCYFVARKVKEPSTDQNPSYSPIFKMRRVGKDGKTIFVYKLRSMHPYSEYLQEFVYNNNSLDIGGKFRDDFRITSWGIILRKLWLDELPMLINLFRGDCKLVGVRPLSRHYLTLYDEQFREKRFKHKPGLIPPYYADLPKTLDEIIQSEARYLNMYEKHRFITDVRYLLKAVNNIVLRGRRSA